jgi:CheY-like chemotaxis protein
MHALVIEDEPLIAMLIEEELRDLGYLSIEIASTQEQAIALAAQHCPDLITADDKLASGSGIEAVKAICESQAIAVVFITGNSLELGIPDVVSLAKPFRTADLREAVALAPKVARTYV